MKFKEIKQICHDLIIDFYQEKQDEKAGSGSDKSNKK
jgi:hypothetical protein